MLGIKGNGFPDLKNKCTETLERTHWERKKHG